MKKTILTFAAIFIATQLFSQDLDSISKNVISEIKTSLTIDSNQISNDNYHQISKNILNEFINNNLDYTKTDIIDLYQLSVKNNLIVNGAYIITGNTLEHISNELLRVIDDNTSKKQTKYGFYSIEYNNQYVLVVVSVINSDPTKNCLTKTEITF
jgi:hypothetical protein